MEYRTEKFGELEYLLRFPDGYEEKDRLPVLIFLHGAGTRGNDINMVREHVFFKTLDSIEQFPMIYAAPQCRFTTWFDVFETLKRFVSFISVQPFADAQKIYLMGASMGGYATWQLAISMPEAFAAIVPICGGGIYCFTDRLLNVPAWAFHGALDTTVEVTESVKMVKALNAFGGSARLTVYPENGHDAWNDTFRNPEVYRWLLSKAKSSERSLTERLSGTEKFG